MNGAKIIVDTLLKKNIKVIFGYPGGSVIPLYDALFNSSINHILCRHEQGAIFSAIGYSRSSKKIGVCIVTSGPGVTNLVTGLSDAYIDSIPIIVITGQVSSNLIGTHAFQEIDTIGLSLSCTKHSFLIKKVDSLEKILIKSFYIASHDRPGPVLIDVPKDIQLTKKNKKTIFYNFNKSIITYKKYLKKAKFLLYQSKKPILYVGGGVYNANAVYSLRKMIEVTKIPTTVTLKGIGSADYNNKYYLGMLGMHGSKIANIAVQKCDLLIAIGSRFDDRATGNTKEFAQQAKIIHIDIDKSEFNRLKKTDICLLGDVNFFLLELSFSLKILKWLNIIKNLKKKYFFSYYNVNKNISPCILLKMISDNIPKNSIITTDVGQHQMWAAQHININYPANFITSGGLGSMGFGIPAAIGAKIACPKNTVICISGDGSFMMNVQELSTIKRENLSIKIILLDNKCLGMVRQWQTLFFNKRYSETDLYGNPNFLMLASSFGIKGISIKKFSQISNAINLLLKSKSSFLLHVIIDKSESVWPLVPPGKSNSFMLENIL